MKVRTIVGAVRSTLASSAAEAFSPSVMWPQFTVQVPVAMFPYYTVPHSETKVMKVRFREGTNTREVLDFNLYLSPDDVWSAQVGASGSLRLDELAFLRMPEDQAADWGGP